MLLYRALAAASLVAYAPWALLRSLTGAKRVGDIRGRLGRRPYPNLAGGIWIHAVSVGEVGVARNLLRALEEKRALSEILPEARLGVSVSTVAGRDLAERTLSGRADVFAFPFDLAGPVERALTAVRPGVVALTETEIWPLFLERAQRHGVPVALVNGRISERSFRRYGRVRRWFAPTLSRIALFAMQSEEDARRIVDLGAPSARVRVFGNLKYDLPEAPPFADAQRLRAAAAGRPIVVAGSTGEGEELVLLEALESLGRLDRLEKKPFLVLAPRRPERFDSVAGLLESRGLPYLRRSSTDAPGPAAVYLLDSIGELGSAYREATIAFVGRSLVPGGGQNPIEAWAAGVPVLAGPHMENFRDVAASGEALGILRRVSDGAALARELEAALSAPRETSGRGADASRFVAESRGAAAATAQALVALASPASRGRTSSP